MPRVKRGTTKTKKRNAVLQQTKGFRFGRKAKKREAYEAINHAGNHAFAHRKRRKGTMRRGWQVAISAGLKRVGSELSYSKFINKLSGSNIEIDRKILADLAKNDEAIFAEVVKAAK